MMTTDLGIIYRYVNLTNGKGYTGWTTDFARRKKQHKRMNGSAPAFHDAIKKYRGIENFRCDILEHNSPRERECFWIATFGDFGNGYNLNEGGEGAGCGENNPMFGKKHTPEAKAKISEARKTKYSGKNHPSFGKKRPDVSEKRSGENHPMFGITGENHPSFGRKHTPETIAKMSEKARKRTREKNPNFGNIGEKNPLTRPEYTHAKWFFFLCIEPLDMSISEKRQQFKKEFDYIPQRCLYRWFNKWNEESDAA